MTIWVEPHQWPSHQSILHIQGPIPEIFTKKYWELAKPWKWLLFSFLFFSFWLLGFSKKFFVVFSQWTKPRRFIWGSVYFWFLQNLGKEAVRTNMHTTVCNNCLVWTLQFFFLAVKLTSRLAGLWQFGFFFLSAAPTVQTSPELNIRFIDFCIQWYLVLYLG